MSDVNARLAELLAAKEKREHDREEAKAASQLAELELEERFEADLGPRGVAFEIIDLTDLGAGFVVVKRGEAVLYRQMKASKITEDDVQRFVKPQIAFPDKVEFLEITGTFYAVWTRCFDALVALHGFKAKEERGK